MSKASEKIENLTMKIRKLEKEREILIEESESAKTEELRSLVGQCFEVRGANADGVFKICDVPRFCGRSGWGTYHYQVPVVWVLRYPIASGWLLSAVPIKDDTVRFQVSDSPDSILFNLEGECRRISESDFEKKFHKAISDLFGMAGIKEHA